MGRKRARLRRSFTAEFKAEIVELCLRGDRSGVVAEPVAVLPQPQELTGGFLVDRAEREQLGNGPIAQVGRLEQPRVFGVRPATRSRRS